MSTVTNSKDANRMTVIWMVTGVLVFVVLVLLGVAMRFNQASATGFLPPEYFYAFMTLHGLGMAGTLFVAGLASLWFLISKYVDLSLKLNKFNYVLVLIGVVLLIVATLLGKFGPGWYVLYPLPFLEGTWANWTIGAATISLMFLGVAWLLWQLDILRAIVSRYGLGNALGWQYLKGGEPKEETPAIIIIATVCVIAGALTTVFGAVLLMMYLIQWLNPDITFNALLLKNIVFLFGHTIVNVTMYCGVAIVYELLPKYTGRPWKANKIVALSWNATLIFVLVAYFHHLYMDFAQPLAFQYVAQIASYMSAVPATVVTLFGVLAQIYRNKFEWKFVPLALCLGTMGWIIGGFIAVVDSTIILNYFFHNTLWVPAHFHTYFLLGFVVMLFGFLYEFFEPVKEGLAKIGLILSAIGGYGFVVMFAIAGMGGVPRRYSNYGDIPIESVAKAGQSAASGSHAFIGILLIGLVLLAVLVLARAKAKWSES